MISGIEDFPYLHRSADSYDHGRQDESGRDATAKAQIAHGALTFIRIEDGGAGHVDPLSVVIQPPDPVKNPVPIWAPAGALQSTVEDMSVCVAAASGRTTAGMKFVKPQITAGFVLAETPRACQKGTNKFFPVCVDGRRRPAWVSPGTWFRATGPTTIPS